MSYTGAKRESYTTNVFVVIHFITVHTDLNCSHRLKIRCKDIVEEFAVT